MKRPTSLRRILSGQSSAGTYRIEIEKSGFKKLIKPDVVLHVQDALEINFEMTIGAARRPSR